MIETGRDFRLAVRTLRRRPGFAVATIGLLTVGMTAALTIFATLNAVWLQPLPFPGGDRLVMVWSEVPQQRIREQRSSLANLLDWAAASPGIESLAAFDPVSATLAGGDAPLRISGVLTTPELAAVLGVGPVRGRFLNSDDVAQRRGVVVISHALWRNFFDAAPSIVGRRLQIEGRSAEIVGVMPAGFSFPSDTSFWEPHSLSGDWPGLLQTRGTDSWFAVARMAPDADAHRLQQELDAVSISLQRRFPDANRGLQARATALRTHLTGRSAGQVVLLLSAAAVLVLLIVCSNVAALLLARGAARSHETSVRLALGAGRLRIMRQVMAEGALLASVAALSGLAMSLILAPGVARLAGVPDNLSGTADAALVVAALVLVAATTFIFSCLPAVRMSGIDPIAGLRLGRGLSGGRGDLRARGLMVSAQVALAVVLVSASGLMLRSAARLLDTHPGFDGEVLLAQLAMPRSVSRAEQVGFYSDLQRRLEAHPAIESAGFIEDLFIGSGLETLLEAEGGTADGFLHRISIDSVSSQGLQALGVSLQQGRFFTELEGSGGEPVVIVNQTLAERFFGDRSPVGRRLKVGGEQGRWMMVVGVVAGMRREGLAIQPIPQIFEPLRQRPSRGMNLIVRAAEPAPADLMSQVRTIVAGLDDRVPVYGATTAATALSRRYSSRLSQTFLISMLGSMALLLAVGGLYSLMHYSVALRAGELGIRAALGASRIQLSRLVIAEGLRTTAVGVAAGVAAALLTARAIDHLLYEVAAADPGTFLWVIVVLVAALAAASLGPALRAARAGSSADLRPDL